MIGSSSVFQWLMMVDKDVDYGQGRLDALTDTQSVPLPFHASHIFPSTSMSKQQNNHPPLSVSFPVIYAHAAFTVNLMQFDWGHL